jgi:FixJ family two-component response regulator
MANENIAVLDDDRSMRTALTRLLEAYSYRVRTYEFAQHFIDSLRLQVPECLILDLNMKWMTGEDVQQYLASIGTRIPTIILTGYDAPEIRQRCKEAGAVAFLVKPVTVDQLLRALQTALSARLLH